MKELDLSSIKVRERKPVSLWCWSLVELSPETNTWKVVKSWVKPADENKAKKIKAEKKVLGEFAQEDDGEETY